jgi:zinc/manganese transport system substrate-binding protein
MGGRGRIAVVRLVAGLFAAIAAGAVAHAAPIRIVAAENFYGGVARAIGGDAAAVTSILSNPNQDPHAFEAGAATARAFAAAGVVIVNGAGYDPWALRLIAAAPAAGRHVIVVADLVGKTPGDNPHLWYDPATMPALAQALAADLSRLDPGHGGYFAARLASFVAAMKPLEARIAALRAKDAGVPVTATEPVFGYMATALGLVMRNRRFQLAVMNGTEPGARDIAAFERDLRAHAVRLMLYNSQTSDALTQRLRAIAAAAGVPVVGVSETEPEGKTYTEWMMSQLEAVDRALTTP